MASVEPTFLHYGVGRTCSHRAGSTTLMQPCIHRPGFTQVGVDLSSLGDREIPEPLVVYFLIHDKGNYSYEMSEISFYPQDDCPGESPPVDYTEMRSLFKQK